MPFHGYNPSIPAKRRQRKYLSLGSELLPPPPSGGDLFLWLPQFPLPPFSQFARASEASYFELEGGDPVNDNRFVRFAVADEFRSNHWESWIFDTAEPTYYRSGYLEGAGSTPWTFPEDLTNAVWTKTGCTITADATAAPDEALTMDKIVESAVNEAHTVERTLAISSAGDAASISLFAKISDRSKLRVRIEGDTTPGNFAYIDVDLDPERVLDFADVADIQVGGLATFENLSLDDKINGSVRINLSVRVNGADTAVNVIVSLLDDTFNDVYLGDGVSGIFAWGLQGEDFVVPTSYMRGVARSRDVLIFALTSSVAKKFSCQTSFIDRGSLHPDINALIWGISNPAGDSPSILMSGPGSGTEIQLTFDDGVSAIDSDVVEALPYRSNVDLVGRFYGDDVLIEYLVNGQDPNEFGTDPGPITQPVNWANPTYLFVNVDPVGGQDGFMSLRGIIITSEPDFPLVPTEPAEIFLTSFENGVTYTFPSDSALDFFLSVAGATAGYARVDDDPSGSQLLVDQAGYLKMWDVTIP